MVDGHAVVRRGLVAYRASVRRIDHINFLGGGRGGRRDFPRDTCGGMVTEQVVLDDVTVAGSWTTFTTIGYDAVRQPVNWCEAERAEGQAGELRTIDSVRTHGTPLVEAGK